MTIVKIGGPGGYEVELAADGNHKVYTMMLRKPAGFGYSYVDGATHYRREIKATAAIGRRIIKQAQAQAQVAEEPEPAAPAIAATLTVYRLVGERAMPLKTVRLTAPKAALLETLAAVRSGLPSDCGASLVDTRGQNVR